LCLHQRGAPGLAEQLEARVDHLLGRVTLAFDLCQALFCLEPP